jgi:hypothetical protein
MSNNTLSVWTVTERDENGEPLPWNESYRSFEDALEAVRKTAEEYCACAGLDPKMAALFLANRQGDVRVLCAFDERYFWVSETKFAS